MATTPIVTEVTKEQLDALVASNGLNEGLQYKVTDKNWLLIATATNQLQPLTGELTIMNVDGIPEYITCNKIKIDFGIITSDISYLTGSPISVNINVSKYMLKSGIVKVTDGTDVCKKIQVVTSGFNQEALSVKDVDFEYSINNIIPLYSDIVLYPLLEADIPYKLCAEGIGLSGMAIKVILYADLFESLINL